MVTLLKLGGSLLTDKTRIKVFRQDVTKQIASDLINVLGHFPELQLIIGHGSGSFGHVTAKEYDTIHGVFTSEEWKGFAKVANVASELNQLVVETLENSGVPVWRIQPSASAISENGTLKYMATRQLQTALQNHIIPVIHGDVSVDEYIGGTIISTETIFTYLLSQFPVKQVILLGEVDGVYNNQKQIISEITPKNFKEVMTHVGGSEGTDVTGGMVTKIQDMMYLVEKYPSLKVSIANGLQKNILSDLLLGKAKYGTLIHNPSGG